MITIKWESNIDWDGLYKSIIESVARNAEEQIRSVYCEEHGQYPEVTLIASNESTIRFEISGCCDDLIERAQEAVQG